MCKWLPDYLPAPVDQGGVLTYTYVIHLCTCSVLVAVMCQHVLDVMDVLCVKVMTPGVKGVRTLTPEFQ